MIINYEKSFLKDIENIKDRKIKSKLKEVINIIEENGLNKLSQIKKLKGSSNYYRLKIGDYRLGFFITVKE